MDHVFSFKRIDMNSEEFCAETTVDKTNEITSDNETGPPLPPRPSIRSQFSLSLEEGK